MNKKFKIILGSSLSLNLLLLGFLLGHSFGIKRPMPHFGMQHFRQKEENLVRVLPQEKQQEAREVFKQMKELRQSSFKNSKSDLQEVEKIVTAEIFDQQKFLEAFSKFDSSMINVKRESDVIVAKFLSSLSKEDREKLLIQVKKDHDFSKDRPEPNPDFEPASHDMSPPLPPEGHRHDLKQERK